MNSLKKGEGAPLLNFEVGGGSRGPGSHSPGPTFTPCLFSYTFLSVLANRELKKIVAHFIALLQCVLCLLSAFTIPLALETMTLLKYLLKKTSNEIK